MVGLIKRTFLHLTPTVFRILYISLVRSYLDYASIIWNPYLLKDIRALEAVQRCATKMVPDLSMLTYKERLQVLNLPSLYYRRKRIHMITTYKIIRGLVEVPHQDLFIISCNTTRSNGLKLYKERANTNSRLNFFTNRIINDWNTLPTDIVNALDTTSFKTLLDIYWRDSRFIIM